MFGSNVAVSDVNLRIDSGEIVALLGRNGAGKTTLLRMILGVTVPTSGRTSVRGADSWSDGVVARRSIGFVPERPGFPRGMSGAELMHLISQFYSGWDIAYAESLAEKFQIPLRQRLGKLSKGTLTQVAIIAAIAHRPSPCRVFARDFTCFPKKQNSVRTKYRTSRAFVWFAYWQRGLC